MTNILDNDDIVKVAKLSKIKLTEEEVDVFGVEVSKVLKWVQHLEENVNVDGVKPMFGMGEKVELHMREDEIKKDCSVEDVLSNAPEVMCDHFVVPKVIDSE